VPDRVDQLYGLPPEQFTAARNALAKDLAKAGDREAAAEVKKLVKPNKAAFALNQIARRQPGEVDLLLRTGERLREAQRLALEGDASQLRTAARAEQDQVDRLVDAAAALAGPGAEDRLRATLRAAAIDPEAGARLRQGRLVADVEPAGFGLEGTAGIEVPAGEAGLEGEAGASAAAARERERAQREAVREAEHLRKQADVEGNRARRMQDEANRLERQAEEARQKAEDAAARAADAFRKAEEAAARAGL